MVNFANAVTKVTYGKLRTVTPNAKGVENFLHNVALTNTKPYGGFPSIAAEDAIYSMGAKEPVFNIKAFADSFSHSEYSSNYWREILDKAILPATQSKEAFAEASKKAREILCSFINK